MLGGATSFNNLIRPQEYRWRDRDPEGSGGLEIDNKLVFGSPLHRQVGWFDTLEDLVDVGSRAPGRVNEICPVTHEAARLHIFLGPEHPRQTVLQRELSEKRALRASERRCHGEKTVHTF